MSKAPLYVHDLLDAFLSGEPLDFQTHAVPKDIQDRLTKAVKDGRLGLTPDALYEKKEEPA